MDYGLKKLENEMYDVYSAVRHQRKLRISFPEVIRGFVGISTMAWGVAIIVTFIGGIEILLSLWRWCKPTGPIGGSISKRNEKKK